MNEPTRRPREVDVMRVPDVMPELRRGKHRSQRAGACFMEFASYLAGERWSDHPACTHPLLATVARLVNDNVDDRHASGSPPSSPPSSGSPARRLAGT